MNCTQEKPFHETHTIWTSVEPSIRDVKRASVKSRLLTGTYTLQYDRDKFKKDSINSNCPLCHTGIEDRLHFILNCTALEVRRSAYLPQILDEFPDLRKLTELQLLSVSLDSSHPFCAIRSPLLPSFESKTRKMLFALHSFRSDILNAQGGSSQQREGWIHQRRRSRCQMWFNYHRR